VSCFFLVHLGAFVLTETCLPEVFYNLLLTSSSARMSFATSDITTSNSNSISMSSAHSSLLSVVLSFDLSEVTSLPTHARASNI
jgi:hypothetical protein